jgi:hypothetical protein
MPGVVHSLIPLWAWVTTFVQYIQLVRRFWISGINELNGGSYFVELLEMKWFSSCEEGDINIALLLGVVEEYHCGL